MSRKERSIIPQQTESGVMTRRLEERSIILEPDILQAILQTPLENNEPFVVSRDVVLDYSEADAVKVFHELVPLIFRGIHSRTIPYIRRITLLRLEWRLSLPAEDALAGTCFPTRSVVVHLAGDVKKLTKSKGVFLDEIVNIPSSIIQICTQGRWKRGRATIEIYRYRFECDAVQCSRPGDRRLFDEWQLTRRARKKAKGASIW